MSDQAGVIRAAGPADLPVVQRIVAAAFGPYVPRIGMRPVPMDADYRSLTQAGAVRVAEVDGEVVGFCVLLPKHEPAEPTALVLDVVAVDPARRGHGVGGRLIAFAEEEAARRGLGAVRLYTHRLMTENIAMYRYLGYLEIDGYQEEDGAAGSIPRVHFVKKVS